MTLESALQEFLLACQADGLSKNTVDWYKWLITAFVQAHEGKQIKDVTTHELRVYLVSLGAKYRSADTRSDHSRALHRFWKWAAAEYDFRNPMRTISYPKQPQPKLPKAVSMDDVIAMFHAAETGLEKERDQALLAFALDSGCRNQGIRELRVSNVDFERRSAIVTEKGSKTRAVVFTKVTAALLLAWMDERLPADTLFYSTDTLEPLTRSGLYQLFRRLAKRAGVKGHANPHAFRHALSIEYIKAGGDPITLARILGHESVDTLARYYAVFTSAEIQAAHEKYSPAHVLGTSVRGTKGA